jgi:hypothetical protein
MIIVRSRLPWSRTTKMHFKESEMANTPERSAHDRPVFIARAKIGDRWQTIGTAWLRNEGEPGYGIKLDTLPIGSWDGRFLLVPLIGDEVEIME